MTPSEYVQNKLLDKKALTNQIAQTILVQNTNFQLLFGITHIALFASLCCTVLLWIQRENGEHSRLYLCFTWAIFSIVCLIRTLALYEGVEYHYAGMLPLKLLMEGLVTITIMVIYPITVINCRWLNVRHTLLICSPLIILFTVSKIMEIYGVEFRDIHSFAQLADHWYEPNILIRLIMVLVTLTFYYIISWIPKRKSCKNTSITWVNGFIITSQVFSLFYVGRLVIEGYLISTLQVGYAVLALVYITYQELYVRLIRQPIEESQLIVEAEHKNNSFQTATYRETELFERLEKYMNSKQAWCDPDLSAEKLVSALCSNRTTMLKTVQKHGYKSYTDYVNSKRVSEFIKIVNATTEHNYQQVFFDVGFRSKTTALRNFKEITGMTPSEYFQRQTKGE